MSKKTTEENKPVKGWKVFDKNFKCRDFQYAENTEYKHTGKLSICNSGFHFCLKLGDCFSYYQFDKNNVVCEVEAIGNIEYHSDDSKAATDHIKIGRRLTWDEVLFYANEGMDNTGHSNTGYSNTGDRNTGYSNTGNRNTGDWNTGDRNTGNRNTGDWNTGNRNTGDWNTGDRNTGNRNTGDWNTGDRNTGYSNTGNRNTGAFCTGEPTMKFFNKESDWTEQKFLESKAYSLLCEVDTKLWVDSSIMADEEKAANKGWKNSGGYYKDIPFKDAFTSKWHNWSEENKKAFTSLPNFDADIFEIITGVRV